MDKIARRQSGAVAERSRVPRMAPQPARPQGVRMQDPDGTRRDILEVASREFALNGLSGARIDEIAARTRSSKRVIYYYFGDKEGLYLRALENAYRPVREGERSEERRVGKGCGRKCRSRGSSYNEKTK